jgi:hypothetical protein
MSSRKVCHVPCTLLACLKFSLSNVKSGCGNLPTKHDDSDNELMLRRKLQLLTVTTLDRNYLDSHCDMI